jgi:hypothetical protein
VGQIIGNVRGIDQNNFTFNCSWSSPDPYNAFSISKGCNISVASVQDTLVSLRSVFSYTLI